MMEIRVVKPCLPQPDIKEILRYSGVRGEDDGVRLEIERLLPGLEKAVKPAACYAELSVSFADCEVRLGNIAVRSRSLSKLLSGADRAIIFAVTVGVGLDREIARLGATSPARQLLADAFGTERVEAACDWLCERFKAEYRGLPLSARFSAGYGDVPLELQRDIFALLDCPRRIGLTLNESLLMSPSKSVTAIVGISRGKDFLAQG